MIFDRKTVSAPVISAYLTGDDPENWRADLRRVWLGGNRDIWQVATAANVDMVALFTRAAFPIPSLPEQFRVWRACEDGGVAQAIRGLSWTRDRAIAERLAGGYLVAGSRDPTLTTRLVKGHNIIFFNRSAAGLTEVMPNDGPVGELDGSRKEWRAAATLFLQPQGYWV